MKVLTVHQPWATLLVCGEKIFETRGWKLQYLGRLAIHAGKYWCDQYQELCFQEPFRSVLLAHGVMDIPHDLPRGAIVGSVRAKSVSRTEVLERQISEQERAFGDFRRGRFGIECVEPRRLKYAVAATGKQGLWDWDPPAGWKPEFIAPPPQQAM